VVLMHIYMLRLALIENFISALCERVCRLCVCVVCVCVVHLVRRGSFENKEICDRASSTGEDCPQT